MIEHVIVVCETVMQSNRLPLRHSKGPESEWPQNFHDVIDVGPFILRCEEWVVITVFWIVQPLTGDFSWSVGSLK